jgi:DNA polymerase I-like protein with 3'-5' exonuclease and polymerase domains
MLGRPHWMRNLITPKPGYAVISADITGAEDWLAAGYSGDPKLMEVYSSGADSYIEFAIVTGALPPGSKRDKSNREMERIRAQHKIAKLAVNYGVGENTLSKQLGVQPWKAGRILNAHREAYAIYWQWVDDEAVKAANRGYVITDYGWRQSTMNMNERAIMNFPQQSGCAEVLRYACNLLLDEGWGFAFSAPHHDALYLHCPIQSAEECAHMVEMAFLEAGKHVMASKTDPEFAEKFPLRIKAKITASPAHYVDADGADIWRIVCEYSKWDEFAVSKTEEKIYVENSSEARDGVPEMQGLHS